MQDPLSLFFKGKEVKEKVISTFSGFLIKVLPCDVLLSLESMTVKS